MTTKTELDTAIHKIETRVGILRPLDGTAVNITRGELLILLTAAKVPQLQHYGPSGADTFIRGELPPTGPWRDE